MPIYSDLIFNADFRQGLKKHKIIEVQMRRALNWLIRSELIISTGDPFCV